MFGMRLDGDRCVGTERDGGAGVSDLWRTDGTRLADQVLDRGRRRVRLHPNQRPEASATVPVETSLQALAESEPVRGERGASRAGRHRQIALYDIMVTGV